jgi:hypothetical protein
MTVEHLATIVRALTEITYSKTKKIKKKTKKVEREVGPGPRSRR